MFKLVTNNTDILPFSNSLSWASDENTLGTQLTFNSTINLTEGQVVSLFSDNDEYFRGTVEHKKENKYTYEYTLQDYGKYMKNKVPIVQFIDMKASDCIKQLVSESYLVGNIPDIPTLINQIYKAKTREEILSDIFSKVYQDQWKTYFYEISGNVFYVYETADMRIVPNVLVGDYSVESDISEMKNNITGVAQDEKYNSIVVEAADETKYNWFGKLTDVLDITADNAAQAKNTVTYMLETANKIKRSTTIPLIILDEKVEVKAHRSIYINTKNLVGYYYIKSAKHSLQDGLHKCDIDIVFDKNINTTTLTYEDTSLINQIIVDAAESNSNSSSSSSSIINAALQWAISTANDTNVGYQLGAWGPNYYDCSHFVITAYRKAGLSLSGASYTGDMYNAFIGEGFEDVTSSVNLSTGEGLQPGDVLLNAANHTEIYSGNGKMVGARTSNAAFADQVQEHNYRNYPWDYVLRYSVSADSSSYADINGEEKITVDLSFYTGAEDEGGNISASGKTLQYGMCASNYYSFGTQFKITGINGLDDGVFTVEDRGGSDFNSSNRLDIYVGNDNNSKALANRLGRQTCTAYKLN